MRFVDFQAQFNAPAPKITRFPTMPWACSGAIGSWSFSQSATTDNGSTGALLQEYRIGAWTLWLLGELHGYNGSCAVDHAQYLADFAAELCAGKSKPETLNGHFLLFGWDSAEQQLHAWTNRLGTLHAYYTQAGSRAAIGTFFQAVAASASQRQLDWLGLTGFMGFGFFPEDRTYYQDVRILRPATHTVWDGAGNMVKQSRYWEWRYEPNTARSYRETVDEFGETLIAILADLTGSGRIAVPISGGLDSRTAAAVITRDAQPAADRQALLARLWAYSYGYVDYSPETAIAARIARARHLAFQRFTVPNYLLDCLDPILASVEGFQGVASTRQAALTDDLAAHADYVIAAHWGDVWMDDMGLVGVDAGRLSDDYVAQHTLHKMEKPGRQWLFAQLCQPQLAGANPEELLRSFVVAELARAGHFAEPDFQVKVFKTEQWSFRWTTASLRMFQPGAFPLLPFYDNRMVDLCCSIPAQFVKGRRLQIDYLKRFHPDLARITWEVSDSSLYFYQHYDSWLLPKRAWRKLERVVTGRRHVGRNWEVQLLNEQGRAGLDHWLLAPGRQIQELVDPTVLQQLVRDFYARPTAENGYAVTQLLTLATWLEKYN